MSKYNWVGIPEKFKWCATDACGLKTFFVNKPIMDDRYCEWFTRDDDYHVYMGGGSYTGHWEQSLEERPILN
ncbi:MAG: hypothetical protein L0G96_15090 [Acinetobacter sp.]|jgi:hypothetical protein|nr:hypothetical protein [Acinetobacter sp.]